MNLLRFIPVLTWPLLSCCAHRPAGVAGYLLPETVQFGLTVPNAINGPVSSTTRTASAPHNPSGQIGVTLTGTWRILPIRVERAEAQPVRVVPPTPPTPAPTSHGNP